MGVKGVMGVCWFEEGFEEEAEKVDDGSDGVVIVLRPHLGQRGDSRGVFCGEERELLRAERRGW